jgi:hypothetical protein
MKCSSFLQLEVTSDRGPFGGEPPNNPTLVATVIPVVIKQLSLESKLHSYIICVCT